MEKRVKIVVLIGIILVIGAPILGFFLDKLILYSAAPETPPNQETSQTDIAESNNLHVSLAKNQKLVIEFSVYYPDVSVTLKILGKGAYDAAVATNANPNGITGENFVYSEFTWGQSPSSSTSSTSSRTITEDGYWYIEFAGTTSGDYLVSRPGDYEVVVYGTNSGSSTEVAFNITIKTDGPGEFLQYLLLTIGIIILVIFALYFSYSYLNKLRRNVD
ncbi:MAG: hypothetical protein P8Y23_18895 [Candidatus Lokiarchaeota archaeon]